MTKVGESNCSGLFFFFPALSPKLFSWLVIEAEKRGALGLDFHLIFGF